MTMDCTPTTSAPTEASVWGHNSRFQCFSAPQDGTDDNTIISCKDVWLDVFWVAVRRDGRPLVPNLNINGSYPPSSALSSMTIRIFSLLSSPPRRTDYYYECDGRPPMAERTQREVTMREGDATSQRLSFTSNISRRADVSSAAAQWWRIQSPNRQREHLVSFLQHFWRVIISLLTDQWTGIFNVNASGSDPAIGWLELQWQQFFLLEDKRDTLNMKYEWYHRLHLWILQQRAGCYDVAGMHSVSQK